MTAYVISDVELRDPEAAATYRSRAADSIETYGGRYVVRGGAVDAVEGNWTPANIVVVEFPSMARARDWYASSEYGEALKVRDAALKRRLIFVGGGGRLERNPCFNFIKGRRDASALFGSFQ
jgi:uncharacterized protein (DUF1330 family)